MSQTPFQRCAAEGCEVGLVYPEKYGVLCYEHLGEQHAAAIVLLFEWVRFSANVADNELHERIPIEKRTEDFLVGLPTTVNT